jgi:hypothetical protein
MVETTLHVVDPKNPGCVDEILHLGDYWNVQAMESNKEEILKYNKEVGRHFARAYKYLAAAREIMDDIEDKHKRAMAFGKVNLLMEDLAKEIFGNMVVSPEPGKERHLFGSAYTPGGFVDYAEDLLDKVDRVYYIEGKPGTGKTTIMNRLATYALDRGLSVEFFHAPLKPMKLDSIIIGELGIAITCSPRGKKFAAKSFDLGSFLDKEAMEEYKGYIQRDLKIFNILLDEVIASIATAKKVHDKLETYYIPNMNFDEINSLRSRIVERILEYGRS